MAFCQLTKMGKNGIIFCVVIRGLIFKKNSLSEIKEILPLIVRYDSRSTLYKEPFGAVRCGEETDFRIFVYNDIYVEQVFFCTECGMEYPVSYVGCEDGYSRYELRVSFSEPKAYFYSFRFVTEQGIFYGKNRDGKLVLDEVLPSFQLTVYERDFSTPAWAKGEIMYQIFPDRFAKSKEFVPLPSKNDRILHEDWDEIPWFLPEQDPYLANDYFGGNLKGITERLDDLRKLGVGIIYLNPIFESAENHRYSTADYKKIDPYLGTEEDFTAFTAACRKRGIRVILDGVFSHTGADSVYFNKFGHYDSVGAYQSQKSPYYPWYDFEEFPDRYKSWWGFVNLPNVREDNEDYLDFITNPENGVLRYWHDRGVDGWRLDVADELPDVFIDRFRQTLKQLHPEALLIGEVWEDASNKESYGIKRRYLLGRQLDSVMNYPFRKAIIDYVLHNRIQEFISSLMQILENYPQDVLAVLMNSLSTHDTKRILTELGVPEEIPAEEQGDYRMSAQAYRKACELVKLCAVLQFTLPGIPCIYYGDEVGMQGFRDPYCRATYPYGKEDRKLLHFYQKLTRFYRKYTKDWKEPMTCLTEGDGAICYTRGGLTVYVNAGDEAVQLQREIFGKLKFYEKPIVLHQCGMTMPPKSFAIFSKS